MAVRTAGVARATLVAALALLPATLARGDSWAPRDDIGVAAVDTRTGQVLWEAWRPDEIPAAATPAEQAVAAWLLTDAGTGRPPVPLPPDVPTAGLAIKNPWPRAPYGPHAVASAGQSLTYYRHEVGVIALDRKSGAEVWRLETHRFPYPSRVLEAGDGRVFVQIGSHVPATLHAALLGGRRHLSIPKLEPRTAAQRVAAALLLHHYGDGHLRPELRKLADELRMDKAGPAADAVEKLLTSWPAKRDGQRLLDGCVAAVLRAGDGDPLRDFPWPDSPRLVLWCLLQELVYGSPRDGYSRQGTNFAYDGWREQPVTLGEATAARLADHCRQVVATGPDAEKPFAASVLVSAVGWSRLTDAERRELFCSADPSVWRWAAVALVKTGRRAELAAWAGDRPADDHLDLLWVLRHDRPEDWPDAELAIGLACAKRDPGAIATLLRSSDDPAPAAFRGPIRAYLQREIAAPTVTDAGTQPAGGLFAAVYLLDAWQDPADTPLLLEYLKHPARANETRYTGTHGTAVRSYRLRGHVRVLLEKRGVTVPLGVVYEEVGGPGAG